MISSYDESARDANFAAVDLLIEIIKGEAHLKHKKEQGLLFDIGLKGYDLNELIQNPMSTLAKENRYKA